MTLSLSIDAETEARLRRLAQEAGKELGDFVAELVQHAATAPTNGSHSPTDFDSALDELFAGDTRKLPSDSLTYSRKEIYSDHD